MLDARKDFERAWEALDRAADADRADADAALREARDTWVRTVLHDGAGWLESLRWGGVDGIEAHSPNRVVSVRPDAALEGADGIGALVLMVDATDSLRSTPNDLWAATPIDRMDALLRASGVEVGIVTDGRWWGLVCAREGVTTASGIVDALTWVEEPRTRDAFLTLISRQHVVGGAAEERLPALFAASVAAAEEITEALGSQVRRAVELLIQSFSESAFDARHRGQPSPLPADAHEAYDAAVTVMMRAVFLLYAEERGLLPAGELFEQGYGIARELDALLARQTDEGEESLDATALTWHRLLATSHALHRGASFESLRMPAYGGSLFDPTRFPFLTATQDGGGLGLSVSDRVMLHVLRSVQVAVVDGEARRISFRDIDVEQIGYIYEGLLGYTSVAVVETYLGLPGKEGSEPEIPLAVLEELGAAHADPKKLATAIRDWVAGTQPSAKPATVAQMARAIASDPDPSAASALAQITGDDTALRDRITPWLGVVRLDLRSRPLIVLDGGLLVKETPSRKNAGAHYTPRSLAEEVVLHALQPLCYSPGPHQTGDESTWKLRSSEDLMSLKVADIACGSGAFLVAAARYLAERLVEAWTIEDPSNVHRPDLHARAIREVVAGCLYGADINEMAVEMCKLSLWLVSLDRDLPFSFVDDKVFVGNSLLGLTSLDQLRKIHIDPSRVPLDRQFDIWDVDIEPTIRKAVQLRERLATEIDEDDPARTSAAKNRQLAEFGRVTADLRQIADGIIAAGLPLGGKPGKPLDDAYDDLRALIKKAHPKAGQPDPKPLEDYIDRGLSPTVDTDYERWKPLHWVLEAPDVIVDHGGFDAVIGNPPFLGGKKLTGAFGEGIREWFVNQIACERRGHADLVAYFFLRTQSVLAERGVFGLLATSTVAQGDTRDVGLDQLDSKGFEIHRAVQSRQWPSISANLQYAVVWASRISLGDGVLPNCNGQQVGSISTLLDAAGEVTGSPIPLSENGGIAFVGCYVLGKGFIVQDREAREWFDADHTLRQVVRRYLNGDDVNSRPDFSASRHVIDFYDRSEGEARKFAVPFSRVEQLVRPERERVNRAALRNRWWQFAEKRPALRLATRDLDEVIVIAQVSKTVLPAIVDTDQVLDQKLIVFASDSSELFAVLSSTAHLLWTVTYCSTLGTNSTNYSPSDAFVPFPRPTSTTWLKSAGRSLAEERRAIMLRRELGMTKLYNLVNDPEVSDASDPDVARMREIHVDLDEAVMDAYGWSDIPLEHGFHTYRQMERWTVSPAARVEILDRLLEENHRRAAAEAASGAAPKGKSRAKKQMPGSEAMFE
ncbi:MAG TPA: DNA methyltransferase [Iamia sp.]|nr:DNA methyltransferase [Iamia sp.]